MYINDICADICNFADDSTQQCRSTDIHETMINLKHDITALIIKI